MFVCVSGTASFDVCLYTVDYVFCGNNLKAAVCAAEDVHIMHRLDLDWIT